MKTDVKKEELFVLKEFTPRKIIEAICIAGWPDEMINNYPQNANEIPLQELISFPNKEPVKWKKRLKFLYPTNQYIVDKPEITFISIKDRETEPSYLYILKYNELSSSNKKLPLCIIIESFKEDFDQFNLLLSYLYQNYIIDNKQRTNYQKIELINILFFLSSSLYKPSPHTIISVNLPFFPKNTSIDFYYSSNMELPCNKTDSCINILFAYLDLTIIIKIVLKLLAEKSVVLIGSEPTVLNSIISALKSIIFPIKWLYNCYSVLPKKKLKKLSNINTKELILAGVMSRDKQEEDLKQFAKKQFAVDCDINEIFSDKNYVNFCFLPSSDFVTEPHVYLELFNKKLLRSFPFEARTRRQKILFLQKGKVVIDCEDNNKLLTEHNDFYLSHTESVEFRRKIQKLKQHNFFQSNYEIGSELITDSGINYETNHIERSFEYQLKKLFMELIISKIKSGDPLFEDMKRYKIYFNYIETGLFDNYAPYNIAKRVNSSSNNNLEKCFDNAFKIIFNIKPLENTNLNKNIFRYDKQTIFDDYIKTVNEIKEKKIDYEWNYVDIENIKDNQNLINFYGENGLISILNDTISQIKENQFTELSEFLVKHYSSQVFQYIFKDLEEENLFEMDSDNEESKKESKNKGTTKENYVLSFNTSNLEKIPQYLIYMAILFDEFRISPFENEIVSKEHQGKNEMKVNQENKGRYCVQSILKYYGEAVIQDKLDFPYWKVSQVLDSFSEKEFEEAGKMVHDLHSDIIKIYEDVKEKKSNKNITKNN